VVHAVDSSFRLTANRLLRPVTPRESPPRRSKLRLKAPLYARPIFENAGDEQAVRCCDLAATMAKGREVGALHRLQKVRFVASSYLPSLRETERPRGEEGATIDRHHRARPHGAVTLLACTESVPANRSHPYLRSGARRDLLELGPHGRAGGCELRLGSVLGTLAPPSARCDAAPDGIRSRGALLTISALLWNVPAPWRKFRHWPIRDADGFGGS
jgi:hypothetical protein